MLSRRELSEYEKIVGFNLWQTEKDYLQHIFLLFLYQRIKNELIFKGGTALQKTFGLNRFSIDLDFTSTNNKAEKVFQEVAGDITKFGFNTKLGKIQKSKVGKTLLLKIEGPLFDGSEKTLTTLRNEISLRKEIFLEPEIKEIVPVYKDLRPYYIVMMKPEEILAEKVRALLRREKVRDLYDLWFLMRKGVRIDKELVEKKLSYYKLSFRKKELESSISRLEDSWDHDLKPIVKVFPTFIDVKKFILTEVDKIKLI